MNNYLPTTWIILSIIAAYLIVNDAKADSGQQMREMQMQQYLNDQQFRYLRATTAPPNYGGYNTRLNEDRLDRMNQQMQMDQIRSNELLHKHH